VTLTQLLVNLCATKTVSFNVHIFLCRTREIIELKKLYYFISDHIRAAGRPDDLRGSGQSKIAGSKIVKCLKYHYCASVAYTE